MMKIAALILLIGICPACDRHASHDVAYYKANPEKAQKVVNEFKGKYMNNPAEEKPTSDYINADAALSQLMNENNKGVKTITFDEASSKIESKYQKKKQ